MKNISKLFLAGLMSASLVACSSNTAQSEPAKEEKTEETAETSEKAVGTYTIYNKTGETVTELYLYVVGSADKGDNIVPDGLNADDSCGISIEEAADAVLVLEFTTESGYTAKFETLHIEEAPISLLAQDAMTGATPIAFEAGE